MKRAALQLLALSLVLQAIVLAFPFFLQVTVDAAIPGNDARLLLGLALGFAVRDTVENFIASVMLSIRQPFRPNDTVEINGDEGKVIRDGDEVHLTKTEFRLLCELAESPGKVLSREALLDKVWGYDYFGDGRLVDVHIRRLRTKVENDPANPRHVVTVRGLGYRLQT